MLLAVVAIGYGARAIAGEREDGTLDFVLANPVTRRRVLIEKSVGLTLMVTTLAGVTGAAVEVVGIFVDLDVSVGRIGIACLGAALVALFFGLVSMFVGALSGSRTIAIGVPTAMFAASYLIVGLTGLVSWLKPARLLSPLYHANGTQPLVHGLPVGNYLVLIGLCVVTLVATVIAFERRDLVR